jgi:hypothetical protein
MRPITVERHASRLIGVRALCGVAALLILMTASCASPENARPTETVGASPPATPTPYSTVTPLPSRTPTATPTKVAQTPTRTNTPAPSPQALVPTARASRTATVTAQPAPRGTRIAPAATATSRAPVLPQATPGPDRSRVCVDMPVGELADYDWGAGAPGLYVNWRVSPNPPDTGGVRFGQLVRTRGDKIYPKMSVIEAAAKNNPGALWLIGNEPDVVAQDNATPEQYARSYGIVYRAIKEADPSARVAIAGVSQPTPLRMAYLDRVLEAYRRQYGEEMPVDVWNVHAYILREERDSWGVGIPPGMEIDQGKLYEIEQHADMAIFRQQIADFRRWMAERGQRDKPLIVSEYGLLMPEDYGFPPEQVSQFMVDTFDYFLEARDGETGYPGDDNRLVQTFCWFSVAMPGFPTSDLFDPVTRAITPVGKVFRAYVSALK